MKTNQRKLNLKKVVDFLVNLGSKTVSQLFVLFVLLLGINLISQKYFFRLDLTENRIYSLSAGTKNIISNLQEKVLVEMYYEEDIPPQLMRTRQDAIDIIREYERFSNGQLQFVIKDPDDSTFETEAREAGLTEETYAAYLPKEEKYHAVNGFLGISINFGDKKETINKITEETISNLEYATSSRIYKLTVDEKVTIGFLTGHGEYTLGTLFQQMQESLENQFNVEEVSISDGSPIEPEKIKVLVIAGPSGRFSQRDMFELEQYLLRGGRVLILSDYYELPGQTATVTKKTTNINEFLGNFGIKIKEALVLDESSTPLEGVFYYPFWVKTEKKNINNQNPALVNLDTVTFLWASPLERTEEKEGLGIINLIETTSKAWTDESESIDVGYLQSFQPLSRQGKFSLAVLIEGSYQSSFKGKEIPQIDQKTQEASEFSDPALDPTESQAEVKDQRSDKVPRVDTSEDVKIVIVGDGEVPLEAQKGMEQNPIFVLNTIEWLSNSDALLAIRSKDIQTRSLRTITETEKLWLKFAIVSFVPLLLISLGVGYNIWRRKRKSSL